MMKALIWHEWREQRRVVLVITAIALFACLVIKQVEPAIYDADWVLAFILPSLAAIFIGTTGTDLLVCPEKDGRAHLGFLLPISPLRAWAAKIAYLVMVAALFVIVLGAFNAWLVNGVEPLTKVGGPGFLFGIPTHEVAQLIALGVILFGGTVVFLSSLLQHRSLAIWWTGLLFAGVIYLGFTVDRARAGDGVATTPLADIAVAWTKWVGPATLYAVLPAGLLLGAALGSMVGFRPQWVLEGRSLRRVVSALAVAAIPLTLVGGASAYSISKFVTVEPYAEMTRITDMIASPDGQRIALFAHRRSHNSGIGNLLGSVFILNAGDCELEALGSTRVGPLGVHDSKWEEDDTTLISAWSLVSRDRSLARLSLKSGEFELLPLDDPSMVRRIRRKVLERGGLDWKGARFEIECGPIRLEVQSDVYPAYDEDRLMAYTKSPAGDLVAHDLKTGASRIVAKQAALGDFKTRSQALSGGGSYISLSTECGLRIFRLSDGVDVTPMAELSAVRWDRHDTSDRYALIRKKFSARYGSGSREITNPCFLFDLSTGETKQLRRSQAWLFSVTASGDVLYSDGESVYQLDPVSMRENTLYAPRP